MTIPEFIQAAKDGGFTVYGGEDAYTKDEEYFLSPKAWEAVVKSKNIIMAGEHGIILPHEIPEELMHRMIASLCNGRTLEEFVQTL